MQKIDKSIILSTAYKKWVDTFANQNLKHDTYNSSNGKYYRDIVMNLLHCQNGLCAYTEQSLCDDETEYQSDKWSKEGRYINQKEDIFDGHLDHFDSTQKKEQAWLWENFFMVSEAINNKKKDKLVYDILKPDREGYDPDKLLSYLPQTGIFKANPALTIKEQEEVEYMLEVLGINRKQVVNRRRRILNELAQYPFLTPREFPTAIRMSQI